MLTWAPISATDLQTRISRAQTRMTPVQQRLWSLIRIQPEKWQQDPYGEEGKGFWVVGLIGRTVLWFNDIEDGFNRSRYSTYGTIDDYWCNHDDLDVALQYVLTALESGYDLLDVVRGWSPASR
jgi:hypothetical protein